MKYFSVLFVFFTWPSLVKKKSLRVSQGVKFYTGYCKLLYGGENFGNASVIFYDGIVGYCGGTAFYYNGPISFYHTLVIIYNVTVSYVIANPGFKCSAKNLKSVSGIFVDASATI